MSEPPAPRGRPEGLVTSLLLGAIAALLAAWTFANPPGAASDEPTHFVKAAAAARGQLHGHALTAADLGITQKEFDNLHQLGGFPLVPIAKQSTRVFDLPAELDPGLLGCTAGRPDRSAACVNTALGATAKGSTASKRIGSYLGTYQPFVYILPGLLTLPATDAATGIVLGRIGFAVVALALIAMALASLRGEAGALGLLGLLVALTPSVVFICATLSPSSTEIAAGLAFCATILRVARGEPAPTWVWWCLGASGAVLAVSRAFGPGWVLVDGLLFVGIVGRAEALRLLRNGRRWAAVALLCTAVAMVVGVTWQLVVQPRPPLHAGTAFLGFLGALNDNPFIVDQEIGVFGWQDTVMPALAYSAWSVLVIALLVLAGVVGTGRQRWILAIMVPAHIALQAAMYALVGQPNLGVQGGRWILPVTVAIPLFAGEVVWSRRQLLAGLVTDRLVAGVAVVAAAVHLAGFYANARRVAVSQNGPMLFLGSSQWAPPLGWMAWLIVAFAGCLCLGLAGIVAAGYPRPAQRRRSRSAGHSRTA